MDPYGHKTIENAEYRDESTSYGVSRQKVVICRGCGKAVPKGPSSLLADDVELDSRFWRFWKYGRMGVSTSLVGYCDTCTDRIRDEFLAVPTKIRTRTEDGAEVTTHICSQCGIERAASEMACYVFGVSKIGIADGEWQANRVYGDSVHALCRGCDAEFADQWLDTGVGDAE